jgi:hypothetical protein
MRRLYHSKSNFMDQVPLIRVVPTPIAQEHDPDDAHNSEVQEREALRDTISRATSPVEDPNEERHRRNAINARVTRAVHAIRVRDHLDYAGLLPARGEANCIEHICAIL